MSIVSYGAAPEYAVAPSARDLEIGSCDIPIIVGRNRPPETIANKIELVTLGKVIRLGKRVEVIQHHGIIPNMQRIHLLDLCWCEGGDETKIGIIDDGHAVVGPRCTIWIGRVAHIPHVAQT